MSGQEPKPLPLIILDDSEVIIDDSIRELYAGWVEDRAEDLRAKFMVVRPGQIMEYEVKAEETARYFALPTNQRGNQPAGTFPFAEMDAEDDGVSLDTIMQSIRTARGQWEKLGALISTGRKRAKRMIDAATTKQEIDAGLFHMNTVEANIQSLLNP